MELKKYGAQLLYGTNNIFRDNYGINAGLDLANDPNNKNKIYDNNVEMPPADSERP